MNIQENEKWVLLGASRGLGFAFSQEVKTELPTLKLFLASRSINNFDFSKSDLFNFYCEKIREERPSRIFYFSAGGTFGPYGNFEWKDHLWTVNVSFLFPAFMLNYFLENKDFVPSLTQMIFIGSKIAEDQPDPNASMYCASKHALKGLIESVRKENPLLDIQLFSPGYMNTQMLPKNAWPRKQNLMKEPDCVAKELLHQVKNGF